MAELSRVSATIVDRRTARDCDAVAIASANIGPLAAVQTMVAFAPRAPIMVEGDSADHLFRIMTGVVKVHRALADGRCQITGFLFPGDLLGLAPEAVHRHGADAVGPVILSRFPRKKVEQLVDVSPLVARLLLRLAYDELNAAHEQMLLLGRKTAPEKVASFLIAMARRTGSDTLDLPMTRAEIADYLGLTIETVSRTLTQLRKAGLLRIYRHQIQILDRAEMGDLSEGN